MVLNFRISLLFCLLLSSLEAYTQLTVKGIVEHIKADGLDSLGNIVLNVSGGTTPYRYQWEQGLYPLNKDRLQVPVGTYAVKVKDAANDSITLQYNLGYKAKWTSCIGTISRNDSLLFSSSPQVQNTALSVNTLRANANGWAELVVQQPTQSDMVGFTDDYAESNPGTIYDMNFAFHLSAHGDLYAFHGGYFYYIRHADPGAVVRLSRESDGYHIYYNNSTVYSLSGSFTQELRLKAYIEVNMLMNVGCSFADSTSAAPLKATVFIRHLGAEGYFNDGQIQALPFGGSSPYTYKWQPGNSTAGIIHNASNDTYQLKIKDLAGDSISREYRVGYRTGWEALNGTVGRNDSLIPQGSYIGRPSAVSSNKLKAGAEGWAEYIVNPSSSPHLLGFLDSASVAGSGALSDVDFGLYLRNDSLFSCKSGTLAFLETAATGDVLRLERNKSSSSTGTVSCLTDYDMSGGVPSTIVPYNMSLSNSGGKLISTLQTGMSGYDARLGSNIAAVAYRIEYDWDPGNLTSSDNVFAVPYDYNGGLYFGTYFFTAGTVPPAGHYTFTYTPTMTGPSFITAVAFSSANASTTHTFSVDNLKMCPISTVTANSCLTEYDMSGSVPANIVPYNMSLSTGAGKLICNLQPGMSGFDARLGSNITATAYVIEYDWNPGNITAADNVFAVPYDYNGSLYFGTYFFTAGTVPPAGHYTFTYTPTMTGAGFVTAVAFSSAYASSTHTFSIDNLKMCPLSMYNMHYSLVKNGEEKASGTASKKELHLKAQVNAPQLLNVGTSFTRPLEVDYNLNSAVSAEAPSSGYIYLTPRYGKKPYRYHWSNASTASELQDLGIGTYTVLVTDSLLDSVSYAFHIGYETGWTNIRNMTASSDGNYVVVDHTKPAAAHTNKYIGEGQDGYYTFEIRDAASNFNFLLQPYDTAAGLTGSRPVLVRQSIINIPRSELPGVGTAAYNAINFADTVTTGTHASVILKEFVADTCAGCARLHYTGAQIDYGKLYTLYDGLTIQKGTDVQSRDVVQIQVTDGDPDISLNNFPLPPNWYNPYNSYDSPQIGIINIYGGTKGPAVVNIGSGGIIGGIGSDIPDNYASEGCGTCSGDAAINSVKTRLFNEAGMVVAESKEYYDYQGRIKQSQVKNLTERKIIITQPLYDAYGRQTGQTLPAPVNTECFCYKNDFILSASTNNAYIYNDFDKPNYYSNTLALTYGERDKPVPVKNNVPYNLGWYYSNNNNWEKYVATAETPYSRIEYSSVDPSSVLKVSQPGNKLNSGSGHESYTIKMATSGELNTVFGAGLGWRIDDFSNFYESNACTNVLEPISLANTTPLTVKSINIDGNGLETVAFMDLTGNLVATCMAGQVNSSNIKTQTVKSRLAFNDETQRYVDVHLPEGCESSLIISQPTGGPSSSGGWPVYNIINLKTGEYVKNSGSTDWYNTSNLSIQPNLPPGFYRIFVKSFPSVYTAPNGEAWITYELNYYNFSTYYYDYANRQKAAISPNGQDNAYVYSGEKKYINSTTGIKIIESIANAPLFFPENVTWSTTDGTFSNKIPLNLPEQTQSYENINLDILLSGKAGMALGEALGASYGDSRVLQNTTSTGNYGYPEYSLDTTEVTSIPSNIRITKVQTLHFNTSIALLNAANETIAGTTRQSGDLFCTISFDSLGNKYVSWSPVKFSYRQLFGTEVAPQTWDKVKILKLEPFAPELGEDYSQYSSLADELIVTVNAWKLSTNTAPQPTMAERYRYDSWSNVISTVTPDEGRSDMVYTKDCRPKFSRNAKQNAAGTNAYQRQYLFFAYDEVDRPVRSGINDPSMQNNTKIYFKTYEDEIAGTSYGTPPSGASYVSINSIADNYDPGTWTGGTGEMIEMYYDTYDPLFWSQNGSPASGLDPAFYVQRHLSGRLSYSKNNKKQTWYSYDEYGRAEWMVQKYIGMNPSNGDIIKTFRYKYDASGNMGEMVYNAESTVDGLHHFYEYDQDNRLKRVYTQRQNTVPATTAPKALQALYTYYLHGPLKRVELGDKMQGIDYVYTINGWVKGINSAEMDAEHDPGKDGFIDNSPANTFKDLFGMNLEYYSKDYERGGTNVQTVEEDISAPYASDLFNGTIKCQRWQTRTAFSPGAVSYANQQLMYGYQYDKKYQLKQAQFALVSANDPEEFNLHPASTTDNYKVQGLTYDDNGNLLSLQRNAWSGGGGGLNMDDLSYAYNSCSNRLNKATDAVSSTAYGSFGFKPSQANNNYIYNEIGELTGDASNNKKYEYNIAGNIVKIRDMSNNLVAEYEYDETGYRILKIAHLSSTSQKRTFYVRDAGGNIMATFEKTANGNTTAYAAPAEWNVYAAGRVGILDNTGGTESYIYELSDHLGNVRTTFKKQSKTSISTTFNSNASNDEGWFNNANTTVTNAFDGSINGTPTNYFIHTKKTTGHEYGAGSKLIPVKAGNSITLSWKALWETGTAPTAGMEIKLTDAAGNLLGGPAAMLYAPITGAGGVSNWQNYSLVVNITANYPDMYLSFYPHNKDNSGKTAYFDDLSATFSSGNIYEPSMLNMADYYPHGSVMPGLNYNSSYKYRYGYQGQFAEMDDESSESNFELRNYDALLGRFKTTDPYGQYWSPYLAMGNSHPNAVDPDGGFSTTGMIVGAAIGGAVGTGIVIANRSNMSGESMVATVGGFMAAGALAGGFHAEIGSFVSKLSLNISIAPELGSAIGQASQMFGDDPPVKMKPASAYDYSKGYIPGKPTADWKYVWDGDNGNIFTRIWDIVKRDWGQASTSEKLDLALSAGGPLLRIGKFAVPKDLFHRAIKQSILKAASKVGKFEKIVGKNPDIGIENGKIILKGTGPFKGKTFETGLDPSHFFE